MPGANVTAIALLYTVSGFVIAADGRSRWDDKATATEDTKRQETENQQKIFTAKFKGRDIAFALTGLAFNADKTFDLIAESLKFTALLSKENSLYEYIGNFSRLVTDAFSEARRSGRIQRFGGNPLCPAPEERNTIARIFFSGYFRKNEPSLAIVKISHDNQVVLEPEKMFQSPPQQNIFSGSSVAELMYGREDPRFAKYFVQADRNSSLEQAEACARGFIEACADPIARDIDPSCNGIGGHIHVARLTPLKGFEWVKGFEPITIGA